MAKSNEMTWSHVNGNLVASFTMNVSGGDLPKDYVAEIPVVLTIGNSLDAVKEYVAGGQSARVVMQGVLRKFKRAELDTLATKGIKIAIADIKTADAYRSPETLKARKEEAVMAAFKAMTKEEREAYLTKLMAIE